MKKKYKETDINKRGKSDKRRNSSFLRDERHPMRKVSSAITLNARSGLVHRSTPRERRQIRVVAYSCQIGANVARSARDCPRFCIRAKPGSIYLHTGRWIGDRAIGERASRLFPGRRAVHTIPAVGHFSNARPRDIVRIEPLGGAPRARAQVRLVAMFTA